MSEQPNPPLQTPTGDPLELDRPDGTGLNELDERETEMEDTTEEAG